MISGRAMKMNEIREDISKWPLAKRVDTLKKIFKKKMGYELDLENPKYFSEMMQWIKLYYHDPRMSRCVDKVTFKDYIREQLGKDGYTAKLYQVWESPGDVDLDSIPDRCVIKSNCSSDGYNIIIVTDKEKLDKKKAEEEIKGSWFDKLALHTNSFASYYYDVKPKVIVEEYLADVASGADDYDVLCFHGVPKFIYVKSNHFADGKNLKSYPVSFYTLDWKYMDVQYEGYPSKKDIPKPVHLDEILEISCKLAKGLPFVRVDFFETPQSMHIAEIAFVAWAGMRHYEPDSFDLEMGGWLDITNHADIRYVVK